MKRFHGLDKLSQSHQGMMQAQTLGKLLLNDLQQCQCHIYGGIADDDNILLAALNLVPDSLVYDAFDQRLDFVVAGPILRNDCVPLTYRLQGNQFAISGRCSMISKVCGVDLYLHGSYTGSVGDMARQYFSLPIKPLLKLIKSI